jgi:hypothetical protein
MACNSEKWNERTSSGLHKLVQFRIRSIVGIRLEFLDKDQTTVGKLYAKMDLFLHANDECPEIRFRDRLKFLHPLISLICRNRQIRIGFRPVAPAPIPP